MGVTSEEIAAWTGLAASATAVLWHGILHVPLRSGVSRVYPLVETYYAYFALLICAFAQVIRFLAEARGHGLYAERPDGTTTWLRPVGEGTAWLLMLGAYSMLCKSGVVHFLGVSLAWLVTAMCVLFVALTPQHGFDNGSFLLLACFGAAATVAFLWFFDDATERLPNISKLLLALGIATYIVLSAVDLVNPHVAPTAVMAWLFASCAISELVYVLVAYYNLVDSHVLKWLLHGERVTQVLVAGT
jgi:hypothetical protein